MTLQPDDIEHAVEQGFNFASRFDDPNHAINDYLELLTIANTLTKAQIEEVANKIVERFKKENVVKLYIPKRPQGNRL